MLTRKHSIAPLMTIPLLTLLAASAGAQERARDRDDRVTVRGGSDALPEVRANSPSGRFGSKGQIAVSSDTGFSISNTSVSGIDGSSTQIVLRPAVDYFVMDYLSVGGFVGVEYTSTPGGSASSVSIGPRVGYNLPLSERLSFWPKLGFAIARTSQTDEGAVLPGGTIVGGDDEDNTSVQLNIFAPLMFHPVQHFFLGLGPAFDLDLNGDAKATTIAIRLTLGGWI
jgi:hypothetical protein